MVTSERQLIRCVAVALALVCIAIVTTFAALKAGTPLFGAIPWPEVVYGPAITAGCCFLLFYAAYRLECWIRGSK
jgi:hypothetical protein